MDGQERKHCATDKKYYPLQFKLCAVVLLKGQSSWQEEKKIGQILASVSILDPSDSGDRINGGKKLL